jgi:hypothetical protein
MSGIVDGYNTASTNGGLFLAAHQPETTWCEGLAPSTQRDGHGQWAATDALDAPVHKL